MKHIDEIEKHLDSNRKMLLYSLRQEDWVISGVDDDISDWALDQKWLIKSEKKYNGKHDGMNRVVAVKEMDVELDPYSGEISLEFDKPHFSNNLSSFVFALNQMRLSEKYKSNSCAEYYR